MTFIAAPLIVQVFGVIFGWYCLSAAVFMFVVEKMWRKNGDLKYLKIIDEFEEDRKKAFKFGLLWPLTLSGMVLDYYVVKGITAKERFLEAAYAQAELIVKGHENGY